MPITTSFRNYYDFTTQTFPQKLPPNPHSLLSHLHWKNIHYHTLLSMISFYDRKITPLSLFSPKHKSENSSLKNKYLHNWLGHAILYLSFIPYWNNFERVANLMWVLCMQQTMTVTYVTKTCVYIHKSEASLQNWFRQSNQDSSFVTYITAQREFGKMMWVKCMWKKSGVTYVTYTWVLHK